MEGKCGPKAGQWTCAGWRERSQLLQNRSVKVTAGMEIEIEGVRRGRREMWGKDMMRRVELRDSAEETHQDRNREYSRDRNKGGLTNNNKTSKITGIQE